MIDKAFVPKLTEHLFYATRDDKHLFLNTEIPNWLVVNQNSAYIAGLIDGTKTISDIYDEVSKLGANVTKEDVFGLFQKFFDTGIINDEDGQKLSGSLISCCGDKPKLHTVHIKLTDECNLSCGYCYAESGCQSKEMLSFEELKMIATEASKISSKIDFVLSGGEPLLHPNALEYMEFLKNLGHEVHLLTNGILIDENNASKITSLCSLIKISIDGSCEEINAITRGKNSFAGAYNGYKLLMDSRANVLVSMTVTSKNTLDIRNMVDMFGNRLNLQPFFKAGRGTKNDHLQITGREYFEAMAKIEGFKPLARVGELLENLRGRGTTKCAMADAEISISENGDVFPCQLLAEDELRGGNIKHDSLQDILNSEVFKKAASFSSLTNEGCSTCPIKLLCGGACRARSYLETGSLFVNSDFCEYEQLAYINGIFDSVSFGGKNEANI